MRWKKLDLEVSLRPFRGMTDAAFRIGATVIFDQWLPLIKEADTVSLMLWAADGSEILDYNSVMSDAFEWGYWIGTACAKKYRPPIDVPLEWQDAHHNPKPFMPNPPVWHYDDLFRLLGILREEFRCRFQRELRLGAVFDPGPEFAVSSFKYDRHREILGRMGGGAFINCCAELLPDERPYAGFPGGIPRGTSFGSFLGRQVQIYLTDLGFDYIWFSNGFGFGEETWSALGPLFNGRDEFKCENAPAIEENIRKFWRDFRSECPEFPIEVRGTNMSTGIDLGSDAVPTREIYREVKNLVAPVNSPWAAILDDFGTEMVGWMSHIAETPRGSDYSFRFYVNDVWFRNSPWIDLYGRSAQDIYLPLAVSRITAEGVTEPAAGLRLFTLDNGDGEMVDTVAAEVIPPLLSMRRTAPDQPGVLVWLYPFDEYHDLAADPERIGEIYAGDQFIRGAINCGLPLNTVVSGKNFLESGNSNPRLYDGRVIVAPTIFTVNPAIIAALEKHLASGGGVIFYGPARGEAIESLLKLEPAEPLPDGELEATGLGPINHLGLYSGGAIDRQTKPGSSARVIAEYEHRFIDTNPRYPHISSRRLPAVTELQRPEWGSGKAVWVRGTSSLAWTDMNGLTFNDSRKYRRPESLMLTALSEFGYRISFAGEPGLPPPRLALRLHKNAFYLSGYGSNVTMTQRLRFPDGAPVFTYADLRQSRGDAVYPIERAMNYECRIFVDSPDDTPIRCRTRTSRSSDVKRRLLVYGLQRARVTFRPEPEHVSQVRFYGPDATTVLNLCKRPIAQPSVIPARLTSDSFGPKYVVENVSGDLLISWGEEKDAHAD